MTEEQDRDLAKVAKGACISFVGIISGRGLQLLSLITIARLFGSEITGLYVLGVTVSKITDLIARFGLHTGAMRFISINHKKDPQRVKGILISSISFSFFNGIFLGLLLYLFSGIISNSVFNKPELKEIIKLFAMGVPFMSSMMVLATASQGFHTTKHAVFARDIIQPFSNLLLIFVFTYMGLGTSSAVYAFVTSNILALAAGMSLLTKIFPPIKDRILKPVYELRNLISYSTPLLMAGFLHFLLSWTDAIMLGIMKTSQDVGIYNAATQVPLLLVIFLNASNSIYAPVIADLFHKGEKARIEKMFKTTTRWIYFIVLPASLIFVSSAREAMSIFGHDFVEKGTPVLIILTVAQFVNCITGGIGFTLSMTGRQKLELINSIVLVVLNVILNVLLIPRYNVVGAAIATATSIILINMLRLVEVYKLYQIHPYSRSYSKAFIPAVVSILLLLIVKLLELGFIWDIMFNIFIVGITFSIYIRITGFDETDKYIFKMVRAKLIAKT